MHKVIILSMLLLMFGAAEVVTFDNNWGENPLYNVISETPTGLEIIFSMHKMVIEDMIIESEEMQNFGFPGAFLPNEEGAPNVTGIGRYIAIPQGSQAQVTILDSRTEICHDVEVAPAPNIPLDSDNTPMRYEKNMEIYECDAYYPEEPIRLSEPKKIRGVDVVILGITPFQYNPVTKDLVVYKDIRIKIDFIGGNGYFGEDRLRSRFWEPILKAHILNYNSLPEIDFYTPERISGIAYIIIVPNNPLYRPWADSIKELRTSQGINTAVYSLFEIGGTSADDIEDFLNDAYNNWNPAPSAFLLMADYPLSGTIDNPIYINSIPVSGNNVINQEPGNFIYDPDSNNLILGPDSLESQLIFGGWSGITSPEWNDYCVSDNIYADVDGDDLPDMFHGRMCAGNVAQLDKIVRKMLNYELDPYSDPDFYDKPLVSCGWQTSRWFQLCVEVIRGFFINELGKNPTRQYALVEYWDPPYPGCPWSTASNTQTVVNYWHDCGYIPLTNPHDENWWNNGSASGINSAINAGAFLVQHRDHGSVIGWGHPSYVTLDLNFLFNIKLPFVYSTNCLTGKYNLLTYCFAEKFHRLCLRGAWGLNAASETSYSFVNDTYIWGTYDALWPNFDPNYPICDSACQPISRPGQAMSYGKYYLDASSWPYNTQHKVYTYHLFHHHGDVWTPLYTEVPQNLAVNHSMILLTGEQSFTVTANQGSIIALTVNGELIGLAQGTGSPIEISIPAQESNNTMLVTITKQNYYRYESIVAIVE